MAKASCNKLLLFLSILGPGLVVMLADMDAGSLITAAQTGAVWGYRMILLQIILVPVLYITQELTIRLGMVTQKGYGLLIKEHFGRIWAWISVGALLVCCFGAILTDLGGLAGVGQLFHIPIWLTMLISITFLIVLTLSGSYRSVEKCAIFIGLFELVFVVAVFLVHPSLKEIARNLTSIPIHQPDYLYLAAANIGAVIMPWMIFYQQSAIVDKKLSIEHLQLSRADTCLGALATQIIAISIIIVTAATIGKSNPGIPLQTVHQISDAITPFFGHSVGKILFALGMIGASLVGAIVVSLTAAWGLGEVTGYRCSLEDNTCEAPYFYSIYSITLLLSGILIASGANLVKLSVAVEVLNALLLPLVLGFLYLLAIKVLPEKYRLKGFYAILVGIVLGITAIIAVISGIWGILA